METSYRQHENGEIHSKTHLLPDVGEHYVNYRGRLLKVGSISRRTLRALARLIRLTHRWSARARRTSWTWLVAACGRRCRSLRLAATSTLDLVAALGSELGRVICATCSLSPT